MSARARNIRIPASCADRDDLPNLLNRINTNKHRAHLCFDEDGLTLPVLILRKTLKRTYTMVKFPTIDEVVVLLEHQPGKRVPSTETELFAKWMQEFDNLEKPAKAECCDFCESVAAHSADMFMLCECRDEDFGPLVPSTKPRLTLHVLAHASCSSAACKNLCQRQTIDLMRRTEAVHGNNCIRAPTKLQVCAWCSSKGSASISLYKCTRCRMVCYCSRECQLKSWKAGHKEACIAK
jgi:hypothetical protein